MRANDGRVVAEDLYLDALIELDAAEEGMVGEDSGRGLLGGADEDDEDETSSSFAEGYDSDEYQDDFEEELSRGTGVGRSHMPSSQLLPLTQIASLPGYLSCSALPLDCSSTLMRHPSSTIRGSLPCLSPGLLPGSCTYRSNQLENTHDDTRCNPTI